MGPIDYSQPNLPNPQQMLLQGLGQGLQIREIQQQALAAQAQREQQMAMNAELESASRDPRMIPGLMVRYPQLAEKLAVGLDRMNAEQHKNVLNNNLELAAALASDKPEIAAQMLERRQKLMLEQGDTEGAASVGQILEGVRTNPEVILASTVARIGAIPGIGKDAQAGFLKFLEERRSAAKAPAELAQAQAAAREAGAKATTAEAGAATAAPMAQAALIEAQAKASVAPQLARLSIQRSQADIRNINDQISDRARRFGLDAERLALETAEKLGTLPTNKLDPAAKKAVDDAVTNSAAQTQTAAQLESLASRVTAANIGNGAFSWLAERTADVFGTQDAVSEIRKEYVRVRNALAVKSLPPGPATDKDIELAMRGFPGENASGATIANFLRGMAKMQRLDAEVSSAKADWISANGSTSAAKRPATIAGVEVQPGMKFEDLAKTITARTMSPPPAPPIPTAPTPAGGVEVRNW